MWFLKEDKEKAFWRSANLFDLEEFYRFYNQALILLI